MIVLMKLYSSNRKMSVRNSPPVLVHSPDKVTVIIAKQALKSLDSKLKVRFCWKGNRQSIRRTNLTKPKSIRRTTDSRRMYIVVLIGKQYQITKINGFSSY